MTPEDDAQVLRELAGRLGLRPVPPPPDDEMADLDPEWTESLFVTVMGTMRGLASDERQAAVATLPALRIRRRRTPLGLLAAASVMLLAVFVSVLLVRPAPATAVPRTLSFSIVDAAALTPQSGVSARRELLDIAASARTLEPLTRSASATTQHVSTDQWRLEVRIAGEVDLTIRPTHQESWLMADGRVRQLEVATAPRFDENGQQVGGDVTGEVTRDERSTGDGLEPLQARRLPLDAEQLTAVWLDGTDSGVVEPTSPATVLTGRITGLFERWVVDPDLAATAWTALAARDEVRDLGDGTDRIGRPGRGFSVWDESTQTLEVLIVDKTTGALLGYEGVIFAYPGVETAQKLPSPRVGFFVTYLASSWADTA